MKKTVLLFLILTMIVSFTACSGKSQTEMDPDAADSLEAETNTDSSESFWYVDYYVDDFGDKGDDVYICSKPIEGTFSNTATTGSPLSVVLFFEPFFMNPEMYYTEDGHFYSTSDAVDVYGFRLLEYNKTPATYTSYDTINFKCKIDGKSYSTEIKGSAPNGDVYLLCGTFYNFIYEGDLINDFCRALREGKEIKCVIEIGNSKYSFTIPETDEPELSSLRDSLLEERDNYLLGKN